jgi:tetratricopeptide (TPR) repeat protein
VSSALHSSRNLPAARRHAKSFRCRINAAFPSPPERRIHAAGGGPGRNLSRALAGLCRLFVLALALWPLAACPEALSQSNPVEQTLPIPHSALRTPHSTLAAGFEAANKLYEKGEYAAAAASYERLLQGGQVSAALYFNLGNAAFKSSQIGRAIAAYRQAERMAPRDPDIRANLQFARNQVQGPALSVGRWQRWLNRFTLNEWTVMAAAALWLLFLLLALLQWRPTLRASLRRTVLAVAAGTVLLAACLAAALVQARSVRIAIVVKPEAVVRAGWFDESKEAFTVHDGAELKVLDQHDKWLQVSPDPLRLGWLPRDEVVLAP